MMMNRTWRLLMLLLLATAMLLAACGDDDEDDGDDNGDNGGAPTADTSVEDVVTLDVPVRVGTTAVDDLEFGMVMLSEEQQSSVTLLEGVFASGATDCAINQALADSAGVAVGDTLAYRFDPNEAAYNCPVVGIIEGTIQTAADGPFEYLVVMSPAATQIFGG